MAGKKTEAVIFDLDGTLLDKTMPILRRFFHRAFNDVGLGFSEEESDIRILPHIGGTGDTIIRNALTDHPDKAMQVSEAYHGYLLGDELVAEAAWLPGVEDYLRRVSRHGDYAVALATGMHPDVLEKIRQKTGMPKRTFKHTVSAYDLKPEEVKPHPRSAFEIFERLGVEPQDVFVVGDHSNDMEVARNVNKVLAAGGQDTPEAKVAKLDRDEVEEVVEAAAVLTGVIRTHAQAKAVKATYVIPDATFTDEVVTARGRIYKNGEWT